MPSQRKTITLRLDRRRGEFGEITRDFSATTARCHALVRAQQQRANEILHDLKSPLARLNVALGLARQQTGHDAREALDRIEREVEKLSEMLEHLLGSARVQALTEVPAAREEEFNLQDLVKDVIADANFEAVRANRAVRLTSCGPCAIRGVKEMLRSAIENVARNAVAYTAEGTAVEVSLTRVDNRNAPFITFSVRDHGPGVPPSLLTRIFHPFFRVGNSVDRKSGGTGLGLAIAERAVLLHGGAIIATNHPEGGLVVEIRLPAKALSETNVAFGSASAGALVESSHEFA